MYSNSEKDIQSKKFGINFVCNTGIQTSKAKLKYLLFSLFIIGVASILISSLLKNNIIKTNIITKSATNNMVYYVDSILGSDTNDGLSQDTAWKSLSKVSSKAFNPGDVVKFCSGRSWSGQLRVTSSGLSNSPILITDYGEGSSPIIMSSNSGSDKRAIVINGNYVIVDGLHITNTDDKGIDIVGSYNIVRSNEFDNCGIGVNISGKYNLVTQNYFHNLKMVVNDTSSQDNDYGAVGVIILNTDNEVAYNRFVNCRAPSYDYGYDGGAVELFNTVDRAYIHHNYASGNDGFVETGAGSSGKTAYDVRIAYNVIHNNHRFLMLHLSGNFAMADSRIYVENNDIIENGDYPEMRWSVLDFNKDLSANQLIFRNNIVVMNDYYKFTTHTGFTHENNIYYFTSGSNTVLNMALGPKEKIADPKLSNINTGNFRLRSDSPALNSGLNLNYLTDYDNNPVPVYLVTDIGAYELQTENIITPTVTSIPQPTNTPTRIPTPTLRPTATSTPRPTLTVTQSSVINDLIINGSFENGSSPWILQLSDPARASYSLDTQTKSNGRAAGKVVVSKNYPEMIHYVQFKQENLRIENGKKYTVIFWAKADKGCRIKSVVQQMSSPYKMYANESAELTTDWKRFTYSFTADQNDNVFFGFNLAACEGNLWFDRIIMLRSQ